MQSKALNSSAYLFTDEEHNKIKCALGYLCFKARIIGIEITSEPPPRIFIIKILFLNGMNLLRPKKVIKFLKELPKKRQNPPKYLSRIL
jgi:hypothetical protein